MYKTTHDINKYIGLKNILFILCPTEVLLQCPHVRFYGEPNEVAMGFSLRSTFSAFYLTIRKNTIITECKYIIYTDSKH